MSSARRRAAKGLCMAAAMVVAAALAAPAAAQQAAATGHPATQAAAQAVPESRGLAALGQSARSGKYLFIFFWKDNDEPSQRMYGVFQAGTGRLSQWADAVAMNIADPNEKAVVDQFGVSRAPMPLVLSLAPNGAVTKAFAAPFDENQLRQAFVSPCTAQCLKCLQSRKLVVLCIQNQKTPHGQAAMHAAREFQSDVRFAAATEIVAIDPEDQNEAAFMHDLQVDPRTPAAVTIVLAPPGNPIARFAGPVSKDQIIAKVAAAQSSACPGGQCGPGGCGPQQ
jgi:hypothetical protein